MIAALDIGTSKTCCFVARIGEPREGHGRLAEARILGIGHQVSYGVRNGAVISPDEVETAIRRTVHAAETMAGETIERVYVNLSAGQPLSENFGIELAIGGRAIEDSDLRRVMNHSSTTTLAPERELIHSMPVRFSIDGIDGVPDPRGMNGDTLEVSIHRVSATQGPIRNLGLAVQRCHLGVERYVISPFAAGLACLAEDELDLGAIVVDMGAGTTSVAMFLGGNVIFTAIVPIGGVHITNDIARGLTTSIAEAERLKTLHGNARLSPNDDADLLTVQQIGDNGEMPSAQVPKAMLVRIIQARLEEIFELLNSRLQESCLTELVGGRLVLTGGASQLLGAPDTAQRILGKDVRVGRPPGINGLAEAASGPAFSTCAGLLAYAVRPGFDVVGNRPADRVMGSGFLGRVGDWLRENL